jgi:hypothetical protein
MIMGDGAMIGLHAAGSVDSCSASKARSLNSLLNRLKDMENGERYVYIEYNSCLQYSVTLYFVYNVNN